MPGRYANRIANGKFTLNGKGYSLYLNDGPNHLHGGAVGYNQKVWKIEELQEDRVTLSLLSPDGEEGYPGNLAMTMTYRLTEQGLELTYEAESDADTVCNLTNHSYFNLAGHEHGDKSMAQTLMMGATVFNVASAESVPTGELRSVEGSPMDFRTPKPIGRDVDEDYECLDLQHGYDHNFEVCSNPCAVLTDPESGRTMRVVTDCPGVQLYAGNFMNAIGKNGVAYGKRSGICLETQYYPGAVNHPEWAQPLFKAGEVYHSETKFIFA